MVKLAITCKNCNELVKNWHFVIRLQYLETWKWDANTTAAADAVWTDRCEGWNSYVDGIEYHCFPKALRTMVQCIFRANNYWRLFAILYMRTCKLALKSKGWWYGVARHLPPFKERRVDFDICQHFSAKLCSYYN